MRSRWFFVTSGLILGVILPQFAVSYELRTHGELTRQAFDASKNVHTYLEVLGISSDQIFSPETVTNRRALAQFENTGTAADWMVEGSIREDDFSKSPIADAAGCVPPLNPPSAINRVYNHFLDVQRNGAGVTVGGYQAGASASDWALGRQDRGPASTQNQFSLPDARAYQYQSLTAASNADREKYTALMFRALGQVLHLVEDMAQPQHTRNDPHPDCSDGVSWVIGGHSWYEQYIEARALGQPFLKAGVPPGLVLGGYSAIDNRPYQAFFSDAGQRGLADFSSRNFFSAGTNLGRFFNPCGGLLAPPCEPANYKTEVKSAAINTFKDSLAVPITFYVRDVVDNITGILIRDVRVASRSLWDEHLEKVNKSPSFTLNRFNYDAMADILLPRAVGYAAGFLDRFFRGVTYVSMDDRSFVISAGGEAMEGTFELFHERDGNRSRLASWTLSIEAEGASPSLQVPRLPPEEGAASFCWLIFRGRLGDEPDAIAASPTGCPLEGPKPPSPPLGHWLVYWCGDFFNPHQYKYAMFWIGSVEESFVRIYVTDATPQVTCSRIAILPAGDPPPGDPPPGAFTEHPNRS
jgi:hypothetical protein